MKMLLPLLLAWLVAPVVSAQVPDNLVVEGVPAIPAELRDKVARYLERTYAPNRVLYPMKRIGAKGPLRGGNGHGGIGVSS